MVLYDIVIKNLRDFRRVHLHCDSFSRSSRIEVQFSLHATQGDITRTLIIFKKKEKKNKSIQFRLKCLFVDIKPNHKIVFFFLYLIFFFLILSWIDFANVSLSATWRSGPGNKAPPWSALFIDNWGPHHRTLSSTCQNVGGRNASMPRENKGLKRGSFQRDTPIFFIESSFLNESTLYFEK